MNLIEMKRVGSVLKRPTVTWITAQTGFIGNIFSRIYTSLPWTSDFVVSNAGCGVFVSLDSLVDVLYNFPYRRVYHLKTILSINLNVIHIIYIV